MSKIGIKAVADAAAVSEATVSRVLNNRAIVAPETRRAVERAMRDVGYVSRARTSKVVLLLAPGLENPIFARLCERLAAGLHRQGLQAVTGSVPVGGIQEYEHVASMVDLGVAAVIFVSAGNTMPDVDPAAHRLLIDSNTPFVCIDGAFNDVAVPTLSTDDYAAASLAVRHLWDLGHRSIGFLAGPQGNIPSDRRVAGFRGTLDRLSAQASGSTARQGSVMHGAYSVEGGAAASAALLERGITGIVAASDDLALGALRTIRKLGLRVPDDVSVVGYDDAHPLEFVDPPLTTVRQPVERLTAATLSVLQRLLIGLPVDTKELLFEPDLIIRSSTGPAHP